MDIILQREMPKNISIYLAIPAYGGIDPNTSIALQQLTSFCDKHNIPTITQHLQGSLITLIRNTYASHFLDSGFSHIFFIDSDIIFNVTTVERMLKFNKPFTCAIYPRKRIFWNRIKQEVLHNPNISEDKLEQLAVKYDVNFPNGAANPPYNPTGFCKILNSGTGFMLIRREVFLELIEHYKNLAYSPAAIEEGKPYSNPNGSYDFFKVGKMDNPEVVDNNYYSEDYFFCNICRKIGIDIYADYTANLSHTGNHVYRGGLINYTMA